MFVCLSKFELFSPALHRPVIRTKGHWIGFVEKHWIRFLMDWVSCGFMLTVMIFSCYYALVWEKYRSALLWNISNFFSLSSSIIIRRRSMFLFCFVRSMFRCCTTMTSLAILHTPSHSQSVLLFIQLFYVGNISSSSHTATRSSKTSGRTS